ncbi:MAG: sensor histidine kinase [Peptostreptococcaceae bacterium]
MINKNVFTRTKSSLIKMNIAVVVGFLVVFSTFICTYFGKITFNSIDDKLEEELQYLSKQLNNESLFYPIRLKYPSSMVYVYEGDRIRYFTENRYFLSLFPEIREGKENEIFTYTENGFTFRELYINVGQYKIQVIRNIDSEISSLKQLISIFLMGILISVMITYFIALYLTKKALIPIETAWNNQAKFIQDASHELRTPITIISSKLESMLKSPDNTVSDEVENIADAMRETRRVKKMISDLLSLTKEEAITKVNLENINIEDLINEICNDYIDIAEIQEKKFTVETDLKNKEVLTDRNKLRQLILIFVENAFKYTKKYDSISIKVRENTNNTISLFVMDSGIGIKKEDIPHLFDRFFRSENVRNEDIDGSGIGLSIAKMISLNLKVKIKVTSEQNQQTIFELIVPYK